jgi:hypothetical protein
MSGFFRREIVSGQAEVGEERTTLTTTERYSSPLGRTK